mmetsp:Transcript_28203/g.54559  ORF Transcript_28203/g.54559 Transcript_28203/m.54559 type:complete len:453 (+) Transcript_28203:44-1402(+)
MSAKEVIASVIEQVHKRDPDQPEFHQAVEEVLHSLEPVLTKRPEYCAVLPAIVEPERIIAFRVRWMTDDLKTMVNRGWRVQFSSAIGPYKGGLRFHPTVTQSVLKFLGFEQIFKNSLTSLPMGGGKGGSDFDPRGRSDGEVMRFCQAFMAELCKYIGPDTDVPAGDINVGGREIGYMFGYYKKLRNEFTGVLTGKGLSFGGSLIRPEATGYGLVYFAKEIVTAALSTDLSGKRVIISGSGNVSLFAVEKCLDMGAIPVSVSDSGGCCYFKDGISREACAALMTLKFEQRKRLSEFASDGCTYIEGSKSVWKLDADAFMVLPCATQNEMDKDDATAMLAANKGVKVIAEGANMPLTSPAIEYLMSSGVIYGPAKAANAGGVSVSGLEMTQNSIRLPWTREEVDKKLNDIMARIHTSCTETIATYGLKPNDYQAAANIAGFVKVADAMLAQGTV